MIFAAYEAVQRKTREKERERIERELAELRDKNGDTLPSDSWEEILRIVRRPSRK